MPKHIGMRILNLPFALVSLSVLGCTTTPAEADVPPDDIGVPPGWIGSIGPLSYYEIGLDHAEHHGGHSAAYMAGPKLYTPDQAILDQAIRADDYRGKRVRLSAWVKGSGLVGPLAGLWMRVDGPGVVPAFDNMSNRSESGTTKWHQVAIVLDVPTDAIGMVVGALHQGGGILFIDDVKLEPVDYNVQSTNMNAAPVASSVDSAKTVAAYLNAPTRLTNLDFERMP
jgi:hypothetical protein